MSLISDLHKSMDYFEESAKDASPDQLRSLVALLIEQVRKMGSAMALSTQAMEYHAKIGANDGE